MQDIPAEDAIAMEQTSSTQKTWFIERGDGFIFSCQEKEAWELMNQRTNWMRNDFKILGVSDGTTLRRVIRELKSESGTLVDKVTELKESYNKYVQTSDRFQFDELLNEDDPKMVRVKELVKETQKKLTKAEKDLANVNSDIYKKAFNAELEVAKGTIEMPRDFSVEMPGASKKDRDIISKTMG